MVSRCLLGECCRYDGEPISAPAVVSLGEVVEFVPVCPEIGIGLPVPRDPIRLVRTSSGIRFVQARTGRDLTARMRKFCREFLSGLSVDGFVLKSRSPACAVRDAALCDERGRLLEETQPGLFAAEVLDHFPRVPVDDEEHVGELLARAGFGLPPGTGT